MPGRKGSADRRPSPAVGALVRSAARTYLFVARLLPGAFRAEYGGELEACFVSIAGEARRSRGRLAVLSVLVRSVIDLLARAPQQHLVARPRRPQTLGKTERMWGTLWRELLESAIFRGLEDARTRIGHYFDYYSYDSYCLIWVSC